MRKDGATVVKGTRRAREAAESIWRAIQSAPRSLARIGGDEFAVLLPETSVVQASAAGGGRGHAAVPQERGSPPAWGALAHLAGGSAA